MTDGKHIRPQAFNLIRPGPLYRREAFDAGLKAAGYDVRNDLPDRVHPDHLLIIWNRYGSNHDLANRFERAGATVLVAENAYIWENGVSPHHLKARPAYALARGWHNDASVIPTGSPDRWNALGVDLAPWRTSGEHILVCPNRSFGVPGRMMPSNWANEVVERLKKLSKRPIRLRPHPGNDPPKKPLAHDLAGAWCTVIWSSSAGVHSLVAGVPVICEAPYWIMKDAACPSWDAFSRGGVYPRRRHFERLACAQFSIEEIASGVAFKYLLTPETVDA